MMQHKVNDERVDALKALRPRARQLLGFSLAGWLLVLAPSWYMLEVYDRVATTRHVPTLAMLTLAVLVLCALMQVAEWTRAEMLAGLGRRFEAMLAPRVFRAAFDAVRLRGPGVRGAADLRRLREFASSPALTGLVDAPGALVFLLLLAAISPWVALLATLAAIAQVVLSVAQDTQCRPILAKGGQDNARASAMADALLAQSATHQAMGMSAAARQRWHLAHGEATTAQHQASWITGRYQALTRFLQQVTSSALLGLGGYLLLVDRLAGGSAMMIVASILGGRLMAPLVQLVTHGSTLVQVRESWARLGELLAAHPAADPTMPLPRPRGSLAASGLVVQAQPPVAGQGALLAGVQFSLQAGQTLVVLGPTGAGKTTLLRAVLALVPLYSGSVRLDGVDLRGWPKDSLGPALGYLPQSVDLIEGSLADNVARFGSPQPGLLSEALAATGLADWVEGLPQGLETTVGPGGLQLSAGQRQRVGLARAVYGWPSLVVLDEPNANLDAAGDVALDQALAALKSRGSTVIIVSHRTSVLQRADCLLLLQDGVQKAFGPRQDVLDALQAAAQRAAPRGVAPAPWALPPPGAGLAPPRRASA